MKRERGTPDSLTSCAGGLMRKWVVVRKERREGEE